MIDIDYLIESYKKEVVNLCEENGKNFDQAWKSRSGKYFENLIIKLFSKYQNDTVKIFNGNKLPEYIYEKLLIPYGNEYIFPDVDCVISCRDKLIIVSIKTSIRERLGQPCYWSLKYRELNKNIFYWFVSKDNDGNFRKENSRTKTIMKRDIDMIFIYNLEQKYECDNIKDLSKIGDYLK